MIKFIKNLLGFGSADAYKPQETVKEILTPPVVTESKPADNVTLQATYIPPAKPVNKVKAIGETGAAAVKAATAPKPANKKRRPYRGNKNAGGQVATEGKTKGGNGSLAKVGVTPAKPKPAAPKAPTIKKK